MYGLWRRDEEPDDVDDDLNDDDDSADAQLGPGRDEPGTLGAPLGRVEDPRDAVGLGQQSAVNDGKAQPDTEFLHRAHSCARPHLQTAIKTSLIDKILSISDSKCIRDESWPKTRGDRLKAKKPPSLVFWTFHLNLDSHCAMVSIS